MRAVKDYLLLPFMCKRRRHGCPLDAIRQRGKEWKNLPQCAQSGKHLIAPLLTFSRREDGEAPIDAGAIGKGLPTRGGSKGKTVASRSA